MSEETEPVEQAMIEFKCPYCGENTSFPETNAGLVQDCPFCGLTLLLPNASGEPGRKLPIPISTPRLFLRPFVLGDRDELDDIMKDAGNDLTQTWDTLDRWLSDRINEFLTREPYSLTLALEETATQKIIGYVSFQFIDGSLRQAGLNVRVSQAHRRKGFGTEAVRALLEFAFRQMGQHRITASCYSENEAFVGLATKVGLRLEGNFIESDFVLGKWIDSNFYALLEDEYPLAGEG